MDIKNSKIDADDLFCDDPAALAAEEFFGIKYLYPWQRLVIANIMDAYSSSCGKKCLDGEGGFAGESDAGVCTDSDDGFFCGRQIVLLPTGAGKSLCFQLPAVLMEGATLVIYPLLALMSDQERRMTEGSLRCAVFKGAQSEEERNSSFDKIKDGAKIIIANPEVLADGNLVERLCGCGISHIAVDEAHCVSEWGDSFRPAYLELGKIIARINPPVVTAFTATASPEVLERVNGVLFDGKARIVRSESDRQNIHYYVKRTAAKKQAALLLSRTEEKPMIIFCGTRRRAEDMSREINAAFGEAASKFYHAGLEKSEKRQVEEWFFRRKDAVLCATCAYGMGVDKKDIHTVIHLDPPQTAEAYIQEAGRGGRDGSVANAVLLWNCDDDAAFSEFRSGTRKAALRDFVKTEDCRRQVLLDALGAEKAVCSGCDLCDGRDRQENPEKNIRLPGDELPDVCSEVMAIVKSRNKYYTKKTLEKKYLRELNSRLRKFTGVNIWYHNSFEDIIRNLIYDGKIRILKKPWDGHIACSCEKKTEKSVRELLFLLR